MLSCASLLFLVSFLTGSILAQESGNQNQSDTLINKRIYLPLQTGENQTFCKQYVPSGASQWEWMYAIVYRAFTGQYKPNANASIYQAQGILNSSAFYKDPVGNTNKVNLLPWFDGSLASSNRCGKPTAVRMVDGNGTKWENGTLKITATPVMNVMLNHITAMMGVILGCDQQSFTPYSGRSSQFEVHRFMDIPQVEMHYFIHNIYDSALTSGVNQPDGIIIGTALDNLFNKQCSPSRQVATYQPTALQNMCTHDGCAKWAFKNATCGPYNVSSFGVQPSSADKAKAQTSFDPACTAPCSSQGAGGHGGIGVTAPGVATIGIGGPNAPASLPTGSLPMKGLDARAPQDLSVPTAVPTDLAGIVPDGIFGRRVPRGF